MCLRKTLILFSLFTTLLTSAVMAQSGGGGGPHQYPDFYPGDVYVQLNPNASGQAVIDRSDPTDYPTIVFNSLADFSEAITHEEANWATFFPLGVNLLVINVDDDSVVTMEKFVFEPASSQFLFESPEARDLFWFLNPASPSNFLLFENANKPVKEPIGYVYEIFIDDNGNGKRDPGEDVYVGSSTRIQKRFRDHEALGEMIDNPKHKIVIYPVYIDGKITPNKNDEDGNPFIDDDADPTTGGGNHSNDSGGGDYFPGGNGGGRVSKDYTVREVIEFWEEKLLKKVLKDNGHKPHSPVGDCDELKNKQHPISRIAGTRSLVAARRQRAHRLGNQRLPI